MKRILSLFVAFALVLVCAPVIPLQAEAATVASGTCGENVTWVLDDEGTLIISGTGAMEDYASASASPWYKQRTAINKVVIEDGVTTIGARAFYNCSSMYSVSIGSAVTSIGTYAFRGCEKLTEVTIPAAVTEIGASAFRVCSTLVTVCFEGNAPTVGNYAFRDCADTLTIKYYENATGFDVAPWTDYTACTMHVGEWIVDNEASCEAEGNRHMTCTACGETITETIPAHNYVGGTCTICGAGKAFASGTCGESAKWALDIFGTLRIYGTGVIDTYSNGNTPWYAYYDQIKSIVVADGITGISKGAFYGCSSLESLTIPFVGESRKTSSDTYQYPLGYIFGTSSYTGGVQTLQNYYGSSTSSTSGTRYYIPSSLKTVTVTGGNILYGAFYGCSNLTGIGVGNGVTSIAGGAFTSCSGLTGVYITDLDAWCNISFKTAEANPLYFAKNLYVSGELVTDLEIPDGVTNIGNYAFYNCSRLTSAIIPDSVESIGKYAFYNCSSMVDVVIPESMESIGNDAFYNCSSLVSVTIPESVTSIGEYAFSNCARLEEIRIPDSVESIGTYAFSGCSRLTTVTMGCGVTKIGTYAFQSCEALKSVYIVDIAAWCEISFGSASANPLYYAKDLYLDEELVTDLEIPDGVTVISNSAFYNCDKLTTVEIPDGVISIGTSAFSGCSSLEQVKIPDSVTDIGTSAFTNCSSLVSVKIPDSVTSIGSAAFSGCSSLESMTIPFVGGSRKTYSDPYKYPLGYIFGTSSYAGSIKTVQYYKYDTYNTTGTNYYIPSSLKTVKVTGGNILYGAFYNCSNLETIVMPDNITSIGERAFYGCSGIESVLIPYSVTSIGDSAFSGCSNLQTVYYSGTQAQSENISISTLNTPLTAAIWCYETTGPEEDTTVTGAVLHQFIVNGKEISVAYSTLEKALDAATEGTLKLFADATVSNVILKPGITLDLNGYTLTANALITMNGAMVTDGGADCVGGGEIKIQKNNLIIAKDNGGIIPVWNGVDGYVFTKVTFQQMARTAGTGAAQYIFLPRFSNTEAAALMADGGIDNGLKFKVCLTWSDGQCQQFYTYSDDFVKQVFDGTGRWVFSLTVTGISGISDMVASAIVETDCGTQATATGTEITAG